MAKKIGFGAHSKERRVEIAASGGKASSKKPNKGRFTKGSKRAKVAGKKGGTISKRKK